MRITGPLYEGDGLIHLWAGSKRTAGALAKAGKGALRETERLQATTPAATDFSAIERGARRMRAAAVAWVVQNAFGAIERWAQRGRRREIDAYLAQATDPADLEHRMRQLERRGALLG